MRLVISRAPKNELCALYDSALSNTIRPYDLIILGKGAWYLNGEIIDNGITPPPPLGAIVNWPVIYLG